MKKRWIWIGIGGALVLLIVVMSVIKSVRGNVVRVQMAKVKVEDITARVRAPGKIEPKTQVKISADVPGKVVRLLVKEGDRVRKGQLMLQLDDTQYRSDFVEAKAALASARARATQAEADLKVSDANYERQRALFQQKLLSQAEWDQATSAHETARASAETARQDVTRAEATLTAARDHLSKTRFEAPFDGVVSALDVEQGEIVVTGTMNNPGTQILVVSDLSRMLVKADVDETDVVDLKKDQQARISVDAIPDTTFGGTVTEIGNTAKRSVTSSVEGQTNFEVQVVFDEHVPQIRPGMTADVDIATATHDHTLAVPIQAVVVRTQSDLDKAERRGRARRPRSRQAAAEADTTPAKDKEITGLFVVRDGVARFVPIRTGIASDTDLEVFGDVKQGDSIVSGPYKALRELKPGAKVKAEAAGAGRGAK